MHRLPYLLLPLLFAACATPASRPDVTARADVTAPPTAERAPDAPRLEQLHPDVWVHISTQLYQGMPVPSNGLVVRDGDGLLLVDTAWGEAETAALLDAIEAEIGLPVRRAIVTHFHDDSVSGARVLEERGVVVHGTPHTQRLAAEEGNAVPSSRLEGLDEVGSAISLGPVEVFYPGAGHAPDNVVVFVPGAGVFSAGGIVIPDSAAEKPIKGEVVAVGEGKVLENGNVRAPKVKQGDKVLFGKYAGTEVKLDGTEYLVVKEDDILAILG